MVNRLTSLLTRDRTAVYPWFVLVGLLGGWLVSLALGNGLVDAAGSVVGTDFIAFYTAADVVATSPEANLYDTALLGERQHALVANMRDGYRVPFVNPPVALLWYAPLRLLPYQGALVVWWVLGGLAWVGAHRALLSASPALRDWGLGRLLLGSALFPPTLMVVIYGQAAGFVLLILAATFALLVARRDLAAGAVLGLLAFKPQLALGLALPLIAGRRWAALLGGVVSVAAQVGLAYALWPAQFAHFAASRGLIASIVVDPAYNTWGVHSLFAFAHLLVGGASASLANALTSLASASLVLWLGYVWWRQPWAPQTDAWRWRIAGTLVLSLLLAMQLFTYDLALLVLPFWVVVGVIRARPGTDPALDGGPVLLATASVYTLAFFGPYLTKGMGDGALALGLPRVALQLTVPLLLVIGVWLVRGAGRVTPQR